MMAATAEALPLARRLGVVPWVMTRVMNSGSGRGWVSQECNPMPGLTPDVPASQAMNQCTWSGRVAAGPRALPTRTRSAYRDATQHTPVRMYMSLRSVDVIAEFIGVLPPEKAPLLKQLFKAVKEDVVEAEQRKEEAVAAMIREKDEKMVLADKVHQRGKLLAKAMYSAGVWDGRSCLEYLEDYNGIVKWERVKGWTKVLEQRPDLIDRLAKAAPSWGVDVKDSKAAGKLAGKIAGMYETLSDQVHTFVPGFGLVVYAGVPDLPTSEALVCLAEAFGVPCERHQSVSL